MQATLQRFSAPFGIKDPELPGVSERNLRATEFYHTQTTIDLQDYHRQLQSFQVMRIQRLRRKREKSSQR